MHHKILLVLGLLFAVFLLIMLAQRIRVAYPIFLVVSGLGISFLPGIPRIELDPDVIFLIFLPPLLYEAAWYTSWNDFWKFRRAIAWLALGLVIFTSVIVAYSTTAIIPGFSLALGFLLGGIVSPPDAVAAATVMKGMGVPKRLMTILEGESLVNDASSLIVFRFALAAALTGTFSIEHATLQFFIVAGMGVVVGLAGAHIMYAIHRFLPTTPAIDAALTVMTPYILFLAADMFHFSGIMAVVTGGLFMSYRSHEIFQRGSTRVNMLGVWITLIFAMNALVFILIGLELPIIVEGLGEYSIADGIKYGLLVSGIAIVSRFLWAFYFTYIPRLISPKIRGKHAPANWKIPVVAGWTGMRGVVSLATALSIPLYMADGSSFPQRNLIIFITFVVIFVTLVLQGLTLPHLIRFVKLKETENMPSKDEEQAGIQLQLHNLALKLIDEKYQEASEKNKLLRVYKKHLENENVNITQRLKSLKSQDATREESQVEGYYKVLLDVYALQRKELFRFRKHKIFSDEEIRRAELQLDFNELRILGLER